MKTFLTILLLFFSVSLFAQFPITQNLGNANTMVLAQGGLGTKTGLQFTMSFNDTATANLFSPFIKNLQGFLIRVVDTFYLRSNDLARWVRVGSTGGGGSITGGNDGLSASGTNIQLGQTVGAVGNPSSLLENREVFMGTLPNRYTLSFVSNIAAAAPTLPTSTFKIRYGGVIDLIAPNGPGVDINELDSSNVLGDAFPSLSYTIGYRQLLLAFTGVHWTSSDKHFDIVDVKSNGLTYADVQFDGQSHTDWRRTGEMYLGLRGTGRVGVRIGLNQITATLDVNGTFRSRDSTNIFTRLGGGSDSVLVKNSSGIVNAVAQSSIVGAVPTMQQVFDKELQIALLTNDDLIYFPSHSFQLQGQQFMISYSGDASSRLTTSSAGTSIIGRGGTGNAISASDSLYFQPYKGIFNIDTLQTTSDTTTYQPLVWSSVNGSVRKFNSWGNAAPGIDDVLAKAQVFTANRLITTNSFNLGITSTTGIVTFTSSNTTGTNVISSINEINNSLTTGNAHFISSTSLSSGSLIDLEVSGTAGLNNQSALLINTIGANSNSNQTTYGINVTNGHSGTGSVNNGVYVSVAGGGTNNAVYVNSGNVNIQGLTASNLVVTDASKNLSSSGVGTGVLTFLATPSWTNFNSMITGTATFWSLANGGTLTGTNTITAGTNPFIFSTGVTSGTGATSGFQISNSTLTSGSIETITRTSTALTAGNAMLTLTSTGVNATNAITANGLSIDVGNTNGTSGTNTTLTLNAHGATTDNFALDVTGGDVRVRSNITSINSAFIAVFGASNADTRTVFESSNSAGAAVLFSNASNLGTGFYMGALTNDLVFVNISAVQAGRWTNAGSLIIGSATTALGRLTLPAGAAGAGNAPIFFTSGTNLTSDVAGAMEYDGTELYFANSTTTRGTIEVMRGSTSSAATLTLAYTQTDYVYTGAGTTTWTLPAVSANYNHSFYLKNAGGNTVTINSSGGGNDIYSSSAVSTYALTAGSSIMLRLVGSIFYVE